MSSSARILVVSGETDLRRAALDVLRAAGFSAVTEADHASPLALRDAPEVIVLVGAAVGELAAWRADPRTAHLPIVAYCHQGSTIASAEAYAAGADDVVTAPELLAGRVLGQLHDGAGAARACERALLEVTRLLSSDDDVIDTLREVLAETALALTVDRAALIFTVEGTDQAYLACATDDPSLYKFPIDLARYPELAAVVRDGGVLAIEDVAIYPPLAARAQDLAGRGVRSAVLFPVEWNDRTCGVLFCRSASKRGARLGSRQLALGRIVAGMIGGRLRGGQVLETLREQTHRVALARYESERRSRAIEQLRDYFEAASDGIFVVDSDCRVLFVNRAAEATTGFARDGLLGRPLPELLPDTQREGLAEVVGRVIAGTNLEAFDLEVSTTSDPICVSVTTSTVLTEHGAAILSFRDVTAQRALEAELVKTKEFLEKMIDSAVDAIIAADRSGEVILFNPGAERIYGWRADEVIGRLGVESLYPELGAREVMRMLRSPAFGGIGRLELTRREILTKTGELVPINMTASILYESGQEMATVGIMSDLRDRIRIEQSLLCAQEKLMATEKQALVAELAGTAAHELNQPLTSVMGCAELLLRSAGPDDAHHRGLRTILEEATRMAEIVKRIGRITRYETKPYVGSAQILDLEKSSPQGGGER